MLAVVQAVGGFAAKYLMVFLGFALGLGLEPGVLRAMLRREIFWRGFAIAMIGAPLLTMLLVWLVPVNPLVESVIILTAIVPGVPLLAAKVKKQGGDTPLAVALSIVLTAVSVLLLPLDLPIAGAVAGVTYTADVWTIGIKIVVPMFTAIAAGLLLRRWWPETASRVFPWAVRVFKAALILLVPLLLVAGGRALLRGSLPSIFMGVLVPAAVLAFAHVLGGPNPREQQTIAIVAVFGNPAIVLAIAAGTYGDNRALPVIAAYLVLRVLLLFAYARILRVLQRHGGPVGRVGAGHRTRHRWGQR